MVVTDQSMSSWLRNGIKKEWNLWSHLDLVLNQLHSPITCVILITFEHQDL